MCFDVSERLVLNQNYRQTAKRCVFLLKNKCKPVIACWGPLFFVFANLELLFAISTSEFKTFTVFMILSIIQYPATLF